MQYLTREPIAMRQPDPVEIDDDGFETVHGVHTGDRSPEGKPAHPEMTSIGAWWLIIASVVAVMVVAVLAAVFVNPWVGLLTLVFGGALACGGNPEIWATVLRSRERHHQGQPPAPPSIERPRVAGSGHGPDRVTPPS